MREKEGILYVVATPIGNLKDITIRAVDTLRTVDLILAESPFHTRNLLRAYDIKRPVNKLNQHSPKQSTKRYIEKLSQGMSIAYVANAGSPGISDPGNLLVKEALRAQIKVCPIPGPSAVTAAYSVSGMASDGFVFMGFLSPKRGKRKKELLEVRDQKRAIVLFESCHRLKETLEDLIEVLDNREVVVVREATKLFEEVILSDLIALKERLLDQEIKGEVTLVIEGKRKKE